MKKVYSFVSNIHEEALNKLKDNNIALTVAKSETTISKEKFKEIAKEYDALIIKYNIILDKKLATLITKPLIIATISVGTDHISDEFFKNPLVTIYNLETANASSVAEHILALILTLNKNIIESNCLVLKEKGNRSNLKRIPEDLSSKTLGLIGSGNIGKELIKLVKAFNMKILCHSKDTKIEDLIAAGIIFADLDTVLKNSDIINVSIPLTHQTKNLISKDKISLMKDTATFINTSRSDIVDNIALMEKADKCPKFLVGLDIDIENDTKLFSKYRTNVIVTPHIAAASSQSMTKMDLEIANKLVIALTNK